MIGAALVTRALSAAGVKTIFSLSGNQIMPIYDACIDAGIRIVHVRHEAAAVYMADAWAQVTGEIGVALVTAAPGFANALSPLYSARMAESPVLLLSGDAPLSAEGWGAFQELPQTEISGSLVKAAIRPRTADALGHEMARAVRCALSGRQGPVHVALPFDLLTAAAGSGAIPSSQAFSPLRIGLPPDVAKQVGQRVASARRPIVLTGPSMSRSRARESFRALEETLGVPVVAMESPRGLRDPSLGAFAEVLGKADLVLSIGKTIDFTVGYAKPPALSADAELIVIDPDTTPIDRAFACVGDRLKLAVRSDAREAATAIAAQAQARADDDWRSDVDAAIRFRQVEAGNEAERHPKTICDSVQQVLNKAEDPVLICDGGEFGQWAQACCSAPTRIVNGMSGAIGGGLCFAIAAKIARPESEVVAMMGDGTVGFHLAEFETAARENVAFTAVIGNDSCWNAEYQIQMRDYGPNRQIGCELTPGARYDQAAAAFGCHAAYVAKGSGLDRPLQDAVASGRAACVNVEMDRVPAPVFKRNTQRA